MDFSLEMPLKFHELVHNKLKKNPTPILENTQYSSRTHSKLISGCNCKAWQGWVFGEEVTPLSGEHLMGMDQEGRLPSCLQPPEHMDAH